MAIAAHTAISLTATAQRYASQHGIVGQVLAIRLPDTCQVGDVVSLEIDGAPHEFAVNRRRWKVRAANTQLEITLDHPVRAIR